MSKDKTVMKMLADDRGWQIVSNLEEMLSVLDFLGMKGSFEKYNFLLVQYDWREEPRRVLGCESKLEEVSWELDKLSVF